MSQRSTFVEGVVIKPLVGNCLHIESISGDEILFFCMERSTAIAAAYDILAAAGEVHVGEVIPFARTG